MDLQNIPLLIRQRGESRHSVERAVGLPQGSIQSWLEDKPSRKKCKPSLDSLVKLAKHFGVSIDYLVGLQQPVTADLPLDEQKILELFAGLDGKKKVLATAYMTALVDV